MHRITLMVMAALVPLTITQRAGAQTPVTSVPYSIADRGAVSLETVGGADLMIVGYGRVLPTTPAPAGVSIFGLRQNGVLVTEAGVPGVITLISGRTYAEVNGPNNTGMAFANVNSSPVVISFNFTDQAGNDFGQNSFTLGANGQMAKFLNEAPFSAAPFAGTFTFSASAPVALAALRTFANQRGEFLVTTQPVTKIPDVISANALVIGHFADGSGWNTQAILVNIADTAISGTVQFYGEGSATSAASPVTLTVNGQVGASFPYTIPARASINFQTSGPNALAAQVGSVRIMPTAGSNSPAAFTVFSLTNNGVTVSQAAVQAQPAGTAFRTYVEVNSSNAAPGSIQSGFAIANISSTTATVNLELTSMDGINSGLSATVVVPAFGHLSKFVHELFPSLGLPFRGVLRASSSGSISMVSLRMRYNERRDFLITTTPAANEASASTLADLIFPHILDRGGYTTQFILFNYVPNQTPIGTLRFFSQSGQALSLNIR